MNTIPTKDGTQLYYKDWGPGKPVVFSHGWPLNADAWESQMVCLAANGYRCIAHDRRDHGRPSQPWNGNQMDMVASREELGRMQLRWRISRSCGPQMEWSLTEDGRPARERRGPKSRHHGHNH